MPSARTIKSGAYLTIASFIYLSTGYLLNVVLARYLGPENYGTYGIVITIMTLLNLLQISGLPQAVTAFVARDRDRANAIFHTAIKLQLISAVGLAALLAAAAWPASRLLHDASLAPYIALSALILPFYGYYALWLGYFGGLEDFKRQAQMNIVYSVAKMVLVVVLAIQFGVAGAILGFVLAPLVAIFARGKLVRSPKAPFEYRKLLLFALPLALLAFLTTLQLSVDLFMVKRLVSSGSNVGFYVVAQNMALIPYLGLSAFAQMLLPAVSKALAAGDERSAGRLLSEALSYILILLVPGVILLALLAPFLISLLYSAQYLPAAPAMQILAAAYGGLAVSVVCASSFNASGKAKISAAISAIGILVTIVVGSVLIPSQGIVGAAYAVLCASAVVTSASIILANRLFGIRLIIPSISRFRSLRS